MKVQNTITFIVSRNYGRPLSFSLPAWRVYAGGTLAVLLLGAMVVLSVMYLLSYSRMQRIEQEHHELIEERDALREQILSANQAAFERKENRLALEAGPAGDEAQQARLAGWVNYADELYQPPIRVSSYTARVNGRTVEVSFRLVNQGEPANNRGGFLFAIFANEDESPARYVPTPAVKTNEEGFPQTYKSGIRFTRIRDAVTFRRRIRRPSREDYFTHVTLFLFSVRGGLLLKERYELDRDLFLQDEPAVQTRHFSQA